MTTRFPASAVIMGLSTCMKRMGMKAVVEWSPGFGSKLRIPLNPETLKWNLLPRTPCVWDALQSMSTSERQQRGNLPGQESNAGECPRKD